MECVFSLRRMWDSRTSCPVTMGASVVVLFPRNRASVDV